MLQGIARLAIAAPRRIIAVAALVLVGAAIFGVPVAKTCPPAVFKIRRRSRRGASSY